MRFHKASYRLPRLSGGTDAVKLIGFKQIEGRHSIIMKEIRTFWLLAVLVFIVAALGQGTKSAAAASAPQTQQLQPPPTIASTVEREISTKASCGCCGSHAGNKFNFSPESLNIPGGECKGVRTFAVQAKHVATSNLPEGLKDGNGPENLKTKADIIKFLKDSFALGHKAAATLTTQNMLQTAEQSKYFISGHDKQLATLHLLWRPVGPRCQQHQPINFTWLSRN
jgi:hypothetical protein